MKKIITKILIIFSIFFIFSTNIYADDGTNEEVETNKVTVTEKIPGATCTEVEGKTGVYTCDVGKGFGAIMSIMGKMIKYFTFIAGLFAVLSLVVGGVMYSMGGANEGMKTKAKDYIQTSLIGLVLLLLSGTILYMIAPWIYVY